ncbi:hypothetical protein [Paenirhodobacter populi]|uniref:Uncharacterized protein n=1 Tax=Paenirhodobacter populi TaxID=2306993 RepID=A0A443IJD9_9RHOB|nr:hypothetical protein [Sinirhodobacter populi]RWR04392.1 hypothetical protein D2T33_21145 [Sinirhodobacter populi]
MIEKTVLGLLIGLAAPAFAQGVSVDLIKDDLKTAMASDSPVVWLIYDFDMVQIDDTIAVLDPIKDRVIVGLADTDFPGRWAMLEGKLNTAGFKVCEAWGSGLHFATAHAPAGDDGDWENMQMWSALQVSDTDLLAFITDSASYDAAATEWEMGGTMKGVAARNYVFADLFSGDREPRRVTDDNEAGISSSLRFSDSNKGRECFDGGA